MMDRLVKCEITGEEIPYLRAYRTEDNYYVHFGLYKDTAFYKKKGLLLLGDIQEFVQLRDEYEHTRYNFFGWIVGDCDSRGSPEKRKLLKKEIKNMDEFFQHVWKKAGDCTRMIEQIGFFEKRLKEENVDVYAPKYLSSCAWHDKFLRVWPKPVDLQHV